MNSLSILIYAAEVVERLNTGLGILGTFMLLGGFAYMGIVAINASDYPSSTAPGTWKGGFKVVVPAIFILFLTAFVPSAQTIYMIAASEVGEQVVNTPEAREVLDAVRGRIMEELKIDKN